MSVETNPHNYTNINFIFSQFVAAKNSVRPSKGMAEGGCGGNSAIPLQKIEAGSAALLVKAKHHRKKLFLLGEKEIRRAQNEKSKEYFSVVWRAERAVAGLASLVWFRSGISDKMSSSQTVKTHQQNTAPIMGAVFVGAPMRNRTSIMGSAIPCPIR